MLEITAQQGGGEPDGLPWLCWLGNPYLAGVLTAAKGLLPTLPQQGAPPSWHLQALGSCRSPRQIKSPTGPPCEPSTALPTCERPSSECGRSP